MASSYDFFVTDTLDATKTIVDLVFKSEGFEVGMLPDGNLVATRGKMGMTVMLGAMAGKNMHMRFEAKFFTDDQKRIVVRLNRDLATGAVKGGAIGASKTSSAFQNIAHALGTKLNEAGVLSDTTEV
ncbi:hypothetical protein [Glaciihabitans sp. UYNi722]|uniref:hypothetical protein n=1 Tax=Glaciihabitans sp. UYNi722 TaxID=3156344 RepID=UPI0033922265